MYFPLDMKSIHGHGVGSLTQRPGVQTMRHECITRLIEAGIDLDDAHQLRRIAMTLHRWHELECGDGNGYIERDETTGKPRYCNTRATYLSANDPRAWSSVPDREAGAHKRLAKIMSRYPTLRSYVQGDPRGASLYILRPSDVPEGKDVDAYYNRGIAVYK